MRESGPRTVGKPTFSALWRDNKTIAGARACHPRSPLMIPSYLIMRPQGQVVLAGRDFTNCRPFSRLVTGRVRVRTLCESPQTFSSAKKTNDKSVPVAWERRKEEKLLSAKSAIE